MKTRLTKTIAVLTASAALFFSGGVFSSAAANQIPVPGTVSPAAQSIIARGLVRLWDVPPVTAEDYRRLNDKIAAKKVPAIQEICRNLNVTITPGTMGGVPIYTVEPAQIERAKRNKILLHLHGGGYILNPGEASTWEAVMMAGFAGYRVIVPDYRLAPEHPYPAAVDDTIAVYRALLAEYPAKRIGVFGASTGGALALILPLRAKAEGLPLPAAIEAGTPWSELDPIGDTYNTNAACDVELGPYDVWVANAADAYAAGHDRTDPYISPIYGDVAEFPPTMLTSGTRDLFLSNTVRMHQKLRQAGRPADLIVFEGLSHYQYLYPPNAPETLTHFRLAKEFWEKYLR